jgi:hypothetical protein
MTRSKIIRMLMGTALFGVLAFGAAACPEEEPAVEDDPMVEEEPADDFEDDTLEDEDDDV